METVVVEGEVDDTSDDDDDNDDAEDDNADADDDVVVGGVLLMGSIVPSINIISKVGKSEKYALRSKRIQTSAILYIQKLQKQKEFIKEYYVCNLVHTLLSKRVYNRKQLMSVLVKKVIKY